MSSDAPVDLPWEGENLFKCSIEGCDEVFTGFRNSRLRKFITPEEFLSERLEAGKPMVCNLHYHEETLTG